MAWPKLFEQKVLDWIETDGPGLTDQDIVDRLSLRSIADARSLLATMADQRKITIQGFGEDRKLLIGAQPKRPPTPIKAARTIKKADASNGPASPPSNRIAQIREAAKRVIEREQKKTAQPIKPREPEPRQNGFEVYDLGKEMPPAIYLSLPMTVMKRLNEAAKSRGSSAALLARALVIKAMQPDTKTVRIRAAVTSLAIEQGRSVEDVAAELIEIGLRSTSAQPGGGGASV